MFSLALAAHMSIEDLTELFDVCGYSFDYAQVKDTVIAYLLTRKVFNPEMMRAALAEYKVSNLFVRDL